jgi:hypothetical protein
MEKILLQEEINRFRLLSGYNNTKTLSENKKEIDELRIKGTPNIQSVDIQTATKKLKNLGDFNFLNNYFQFAGKQADDFIKVLQKSSDQLTNDLESAIKKEIADGNVGNELGPLSKESSKELALALTNQLMDTKKVVVSGKEYTLNGLADAINNGQIPAKNLNDAKGKLAQGRTDALAQGKTAAKNFTEKKKLELLKDNTGGGKDGGGGGGGGKDIEPQLKKYTWKQVALVAGGTTLAGFLAWWIFSSRRGTNPFPVCLGNYMTEKDKKKIEQANGAYLPIADPKITTKEGQPAGLYNVKFFENGGFEADGEKGKWEPAGNAIQVNHSGTNYMIVCGDLVINQGDGESEKNPEPKPGSGCSPSSNFPFAFYQMNSMVGQVQGCVGARPDNCMGPQTAAKIRQYLGLSDTPTELTKDIYDKVMAKCGGSAKQEVTPIKEPTQISGGVTAGNKPESSDDFEF